MLRLRSCVLAYLLSSPATSPLPSLRRCRFPQLRLLRGALPRLHLRAHPSAGPQGLPQALPPEVPLQARRRPRLPRRPRHPQLRRRGPKFLCASVERTLSPIVHGLAGLGLSPPEIARLVPLTASAHSRNRPVVSKVHYYLRLFGSLEEFLRAFKHNHNLLSHNLDTVVKRNVGLLRECTLGACDIGKLAISMPRMLTANADRIRAMVSCAEGIGVPRGSGMFGRALRAVAFSNKDKIATKVMYLKKTFRWSDAEVRIAVSKAPMLLTLGKDLLQRKSEFLISEVGLEPYLAHLPVMLSYSLVGRLRPWYYVVRFLKENGLLKNNPGYKTIWDLVEKIFMEKHICPHMEAAPYLAEDYAAACRGEASARFRYYSV